MATLQEVHALLDTESIAEFSGSYPLVHGNINEEILLEGTAPFVKQEVSFTNFSQFELGIPQNARVHGNLIFFIYSKQGTGSGARNAVLARIVSRFLNKQYLNGLTTLGVNPGMEGTKLNWNVSAVSVPFYFHNF